MHSWELSKLIEVALILTCILDVPGWNFGQDTVYSEVVCGLCQSLQADATTIPQIRPQLPLSTFFKFIIH